MYARIDTFRLDVSLDSLVSWSMLMIFEQTNCSQKKNKYQRERNE